jgi:hypothetical protein
VYSLNIRNDYTLADAFTALGVRLYGPEWTGYEIRGVRYDDPSAAVEERASIQHQLENISSQIADKQRELKDVIGKENIFRLNDEIAVLKKLQGDQFSQVHEIGQVGTSQIEDHSNWERFEYAEGVLLRALRNNDLAVYCPFVFYVKSDFWGEFPEGFNYDLERSLIFWPPNTCSQSMSAARIEQVQFDNWLTKVLPVSDRAVQQSSSFDQCCVYLRNEASKATGLVTLAYAGRGLLMITTFLIIFILIRTVLEIYRGRVFVPDK